ncbi:Disease resistance protein RPS5 [Acorus gramineus]|uniref:Disease resistance protein RPS5 n=1 Tax=Acorus gramineus TaxID=55184 RepID=A0AAV9AME7_ACOGR|nr:Disease resistance protein RPS5 [Acorus gramineus]
MGGIGKTTLLEKFKAELLHRPCDFKNIIFTVVSKEPNAQKIQRDVGKALGLSISESESTDDLAPKIHEALHDKKFVLMLDDVWDGFTLKKTLKLIGVPFQNEGNKCKLILTTRTEMVCNQMGVGKHKVRVSLLGVEEAWELFKTNVGEMIINSNPGIEIHAKVMAKKCGGLPLALTIIGSAMASKTTIQEWEHAASAMEELRTGKIEGMEDELLSRLKLSYDSLPSGTIKECFLYCCLYPEDHDIDKEELVDYWVGEGFFQNEYGNDLDKARREGHSIIGKLKNAHLLDTGLDSDSNVRMHDVIRDMAIWIANKYKKYRFLVRAGIGLCEAPDPGEWRGTRRISLMHNVIKDLPSTIPDSSSLSTLLIQGNFHLSQISNGFFQSMTNLRVLDMSNTEIKSLPKELGRLTRLRHLYLNNTFHRAIPECPNLSTLLLQRNTFSEISGGLFQSTPNLRVLDMAGHYESHITRLPEGIGLLTELQHLNLSWTRISSLPVELGRLTKLRQLYLDHTSDLDSIPRFFQSMTNLRVLDLSWTSIESLPIELGWLTRLRYLNLSHTCIESLPIELGWLTGLRYLNLSHTDKLDSIPKEAISTLGELRFFNFRGSRYSIGDGSANVENSLCDPQVSIQDLDALKRLQEVHLGLRSVDVFRQFLSLTKLPRITSYLSLHNFKGLGTVHLSSTSLKMDHLRKLIIDECEGLEEIIFSGGENDPLLPNLSELELSSLYDLRMIKVGAHVGLQNLRELTIMHCSVLKHFSCIRHLRCLESVEIMKCNEMKKLIDGEDGVVEDEASALALSFPKLKSIKLSLLPIFGSICECNHLKKLPLEINSAPNLEDIRGQQEWWDGLVWDDELIKQKFVTLHSTW